MTKADVVEELSRVVELPRIEAKALVEVILDSMVRALRTGDHVEIRGFGSFHTRQRKSRTGRNPKSGARVEVAAKRVAYFKPSRELKEGVKHLTAAPGAELGIGRTD